MTIPNRLETPLNVTERLAESYHSQTGWLAAIARETGNRALLSLAYELHAGKKKRKGSQVRR